MPTRIPAGSKNTMASSGHEASRFSVQLKSEGIANVEP